jgi:hypothetical protein
MKTTKAMFFELMHDFQSERWNEFELPKLSLRELLALAKLLGCPSWLEHDPDVIEFYDQSHFVAYSMNSRVSCVNRKAAVNDRPVCPSEAAHGDFIQVEVASDQIGRC